MKCPYCGKENTEIIRGGTIIVCYSCNRNAPIQKKELSPIKIFVSYGHDDHADFVKRLADAIKTKSNGHIDVWIDHVKIKQDDNWRSKITNGIKESRDFVAFLSNYSTRDRGVCLDEIAIALISKHGMIHPILLENPEEKKFDVPASIAEYQWGDMSDYPTYQTKGKKAYKQYIDRKADALISLISDDKVQIYNWDLDFIREKLNLPKEHKPNRFDTLLDKKIVGRGWLSVKIENWLNDPDGERIMMLYGQPGSGKSMFSAYIQHYGIRQSYRVAAAFACDYQSHEYSDTNSIITWLAYMLAMRLDEYRKVLVMKLDDPKYYIGEGKDRFNSLIAAPFNECRINGEHESMMILIDALDEAKTDEIANFVTNYLGCLPPWLRFLITSRKTPYITEHFSRFSAIDLDKQKEKNTEDIALYFRDRLKKDLSTREGYDDFISRLAVQSEGLFTYAVCVTDNILTDLKKDANLPLKTYPLPHGIENLFQSTLDRYFKNTTRDYAGRWRKALGMIIASKEPMPIVTLMKLMHWRENEWNDFLLPLSTLMTEANGCISAFHYSFAEWLDDTKTEYHASAKDGLEDLGKAMVDVYKQGIEELDTYMLLHLTETLRETQNKKYLEVIRDKTLTDKMVKRAKELMDISGHDGAEALCRENLCIFHKLYEQYPDDLHYVFGLLTSIDMVADIESDNYNSDRVLDLHKEEVRIIRILVEQYPENPNYMSALFDLLIQVARIEYWRCHIDYATGLFEEALSIIRILTKLYPEDQDCLSDFSFTLKKVAGCYVGNGNLDLALELYEEALSIERVIYNKFETNYLDTIATTLETIAWVKEKKNNLDHALELYEESLGIRRASVDKLSESDYFYNDYLCELSGTLERTACVEEKKDNLDHALELYTEELSIDRAFNKRYPWNLDYLSDTASTLEKIAWVEEKKNNLDHALKLYEEALGIRRALVDKSPKSEYYRNDLSGSLNMVAGVEMEKNNLNRARELYEEALSIDRALVVQSPENADYSFGLSITLEMAAEIEEKANNTKHALALYLEVLYIRHKLLKHYPKNSDYRFGLSLANEDVDRVMKTLYNLLTD